MADIYSFTFSTRNLIPRWNYPVLVFSDITESNVTLSWDGASKNTASYQILMDGNLLNANVVDKTYNVSGLSAGTDYKFKIKAGNAAGWSNDGPEEIVTTADNGLPIWPERVLNFVYNALEVKKATVRWPDTAYDNVGVMGYYVYLDGNLVGTVAGNVYSYEVNSLSPNNTYNFWVEAFDRAGKRSNPSPTGTLTSHPDWNAPYWNNTVLNVIYPDDYSVELSWDPATDYDQVANYRIIQNGHEIDTVGNQTYKYKITNLAPGQYTFNIDAVDLSGNRRSDDNPTKTIIIADKTPPVWQNAYVTARVNSDTELTLNWSFASDIGVVNYRVYQSTGTAENLIATVGGSTYDVSGLTPGQRYNFRIEAGDAAGNWTTNGPTTSLIVQTADRNPPVWPINPLTVNGQTYTAATVSWPEAQDDSGVVLGYWVYADNYLVSNVVASVYSYTYNYFLPGLIYEFKVTAVDQAGNSTSAYAYATTLQDNVYPEWQVGSYVYQSNLTQTGVTLTWGTALDNSGVITYRVYGNNQYYNATVSQSNNGLTITGLSAGTEYTFSIEAVDASGNSRRGPEVTFKTIAVSNSGNSGGGGGGSSSPLPSSITSAQTNVSNTLNLNENSIARVTAQESLTIEKQVALIELTETTQSLSVVTVNNTAAQTIVSLPKAVLQQFSNVVALQVAPTTVSNPPTAASGLTPAGKAVEINLLSADGSYQHQLDAFVTVTITYDPAVAPGKENLLRVFTYNASSGEWVNLGGTVNQANQTISFNTNHLSLFAPMVVASVSTTPVKKALIEVKLPDIEKHWAKKEIYELVSKGIMRGVGPGKFAPEKKVTRAEFSAMLANAFRLPGGAYAPIFNDVRYRDWYSSSVMKAFFNGYISGYGQNFAPARNINKQEMAAILVRILGQTKVNMDNSQLKKYRDTGKINAWAKSATTKAVGAGLIWGNITTGQLQPQAELTRAETSVSLYRLLKIMRKI